MSVVAEVTRYSRSYWPVPRGFVADGWLRTLWLHHRPAIAVLPILGVHANTVPQGAFYCSQEQMARLAGFGSRTTVKEAGRHLNASGLGEVWYEKKPNGHSVTVWRLTWPAVANPAEKLPYFCFPANVVYRRAWAQLQNAAKAAYIALLEQMRFVKSERASGHVAVFTRDMLLERTGLSERSLDGLLADWNRQRPTRSLALLTRPETGKLLFSLSPEMEVGAVAQEAVL